MGIWKMMKLDVDGYLYKNIPEMAEHKEKFVDVVSNTIYIENQNDFQLTFVLSQLPIIFSKDGKLMLNLGAFHTGLYGHVIFDLSQNTTTITSE